MINFFQLGVIEAFILWEIRVITNQFLLFCGHSRKFAVLPRTIRNHQMLKLQFSKDNMSMVT